MFASHVWKSSSCMLVVSTPFEHISTCTTVLGTSKTPLSSGTLNERVRICACFRVIDNRPPPHPAHYLNKLTMFNSQTVKVTLHFSWVQCLGSAMVSPSSFPCVCECAQYARVHLIALAPLTCTPNHSCTRISTVSQDLFSYFRTAELRISDLRPRCYTWVYCLVRPFDAAVT